MKSPELPELLEKASTQAASLLQENERLRQTLYAVSFYLVRDNVPEARRVLNQFLLTTPNKEEPPNDPPST